MSKLLKNNDVSEIKQIAVIVNDLIVKLYKNDPNNFCFEEVGKLNSLDIVSDYINHNELGCGLSHLLYVVHGTPINIDKKHIVSLQRIAKEIGIEKECLTEERYEQLTPEQKRWAFNVLYT